MLRFHSGAHQVRSPRTFFPSFSFFLSPDFQKLRVFREPGPSIIAHETSLVPEHAPRIDCSNPLANVPTQRPLYVRRKNPDDDPSQDKHKYVSQTKQYCRFRSSLPDCIGRAIGRNILSTWVVPCNGCFRQNRVKYMWLGNPYLLHRHVQSGMVVKVAGRGLNGAWASRLSYNSLVWPFKARLTRRSRPCPAL